MKLKTRNGRIAECEIGKASEPSEVFIESAVYVDDASDVPDGVVRELEEDHFDLLMVEWEDRCMSAHELRYELLRDEKLLEEK